MLFLTTKNNVSKPTQTSKNNVNKNISDINLNDDVEKILDLLTKLSKKSYHYLEQILNEDNYNFINKHQFPNYLLLKEFCLIIFVISLKRNDYKWNNLHNLIRVLF